MWSVCPGRGFGAASGGEHPDRGLGRLAGRPALLQPGVDAPPHRAAGPARRRTPAANPGACEVKRGSGPGTDRGSTQQFTPLTETLTPLNLIPVPIRPIMAQIHPRFCYEEIPHAFTGFD